MLRLDSGNVSLKPAQRKQLLQGLRRPLSLGRPLKDFALSIGLRRVGRYLTLHATVRDARGQAVCRIRETQWAAALRQLLNAIHGLIHARRVQLLRPA